MKIFVGNWKAYIHSYSDAKKLFEVYKKVASISKNTSYIIAAPPLYVLSLHKEYRGRKILFASQTVSYCKEACTGDIPAYQLSSEGINFALVGHSEQRRKGKTDEDIRQEVNACVQNSIVPIIIVGEHKRDEDASYFKFVAKQLKTALADYPKNKPLKFIVAYEPVWAVGAKEPAKAREIEMMTIYIRKVLVQMFGERKGKSVPILYGGSVNQYNIDAILDLQETDGVLVGRASTDTDAFIEMARKLK